MSKCDNISRVLPPFRSKKKKKKLADIFASLVDLHFKMPDLNFGQDNLLKQAYFAQN